MIFYIAELIITLLITFAALYYYSSPQVPVYCRVVIACSFFLCFFSFFLLPIDIY